MAYLCTPLFYCAIAYGILAAALFPVVRRLPVTAPVTLRAQEVDREQKEIPSLSDAAGGVISSNDVHFPDFGERLGTLAVSHPDGSVYTDAPLWCGDEAEQLKKGVGVYYGSTPPGYGSTVLVAGHNHTYFKPLKEARVGDTVTVTTYYGVYVYEVTEIAIKSTSDKTHYDLDAAEENLLLYTCYPFGSIGMTPTRYFLYCRYLSGPMISIERG